MQVDVLLDDVLVQRKHQVQRRAPFQELELWDRVMQRGAEGGGEDSKVLFVRRLLVSELAQQREGEQHVWPAQRKRNALGGSGLCVRVVMMDGWMDGWMDDG